nr:MAG: hypothetical protein [Microvirus sp.]
MTAIVRNTGAWVHPVTGEILDHRGRRLDQDGREILDPTPIAPPVGFKKQPSMFDIQRDMLHRAMRELAEAQGKETLDEALDFDVGDDLDPESEWETSLDGTERLEDLVEAQAAAAEAQYDAVQAVKERDARRKKKSAGSPDDGRAEGPKQEAEPPSPSSTEPKVEQR